MQLTDLVTPLKKPLVAINNDCLLEASSVDGHLEKSCDRQTDNLFKVSEAQSPTQTSSTPRMKNSIGTTAGMLRNSELGKQVGVDIRQPWQSLNSNPEKPFRLGLVGPLPPSFGGMANQTKQLALLLKGEGVDVVILQTNAPYPFRFIEKITGLRAIFRLVPYLWLLWKSVKQFDCLHVMANSGWAWQLFAAPAIWIGWFKKVPVIVNFHGGEAEKYFAKSYGRVAPTLNKASAVIVPSGFLLEVFKKFSFDVDIIPNFIDCRRFAFQGRTHINDLQAPKLVIARNLEKIYGIDTAIEAVAILKPYLPGIKLMIAGSGYWLEELTELTKALGLSDNVEFTGKLNPGQIAELYAQTDIMLNPTTIDNMPISVLEALAAGLPIVTTNVGGIPYLVTDRETALLVESGRPDMMADKIKELIGEPRLYEKLVANGRKQAQNYAWDAVKEQWLDLYQRVTV